MTSSKSTNRMIQDGMTEEIMVRCDCSDLNWEKLQILCPVLQFAHYKGNCKHFEGNTTYFIIHANDQPAEFLLNKPTKQFTKDCEDRAIFFSKASHNCSALICGPNIYETHEFVRNQLMNNVFSQQHDVVEQMVLYSVLYNNRDSAQSAFNQVELERDKYRKVGKNFGVRFTFLDNKVLFNEIKFQFNKEQIGKDISIFNPNFNEHIILQELIGGWGNIVVRVQLNFNRIGELNGDGKITFDNKLEAELFVNSLFLEQQQVKIVQVHGTDLFLDNQRKQKQTQGRKKIRQENRIDAYIQQHQKQYNQIHEQQRQQSVFYSIPPIQGHSTIQNISDVQYYNQFLRQQHFSQYEQCSQFHPIQYNLNQQQQSQNYNYNIFQPLAHPYPNQLNKQQMDYVNHYNNQLQNQILILNQSQVSNQQQLKTELNPQLKLNQPKKQLNSNCQEFILKYKLYIKQQHQDQETFQQLQQDADQIIQIHNNKNSEQIVQQNQLQTEFQHQQDNQSGIQLQNPIHDQKQSEQQQRDQQQNNASEHQQGIVDNSQSTNQVQQIQEKPTNQQQEQDPFEKARLNLIESGLQVYNQQNFPDDHQLQNMIQDDSLNTNNQQIRNRSLSSSAQTSSQQSNSIFRSISQTTISRSIFQSSSISNSNTPSESNIKYQQNSQRSQQLDHQIPSQQDTNQIQHNMNSEQIVQQNQQHTENQYQQDNQSGIQLQNPIHEQKLQEQQQRDQQQNNASEHQQGIVDNSQSTNQVQQIQEKPTNQQQEQDPLEKERLNLIESVLKVYNQQNFPDDHQLQNMIQDDSLNTNNQQIRNRSLSSSAQTSSQQSNSIFRSISQQSNFRSISLLLSLTDTEIQDSFDETFPNFLQIQQAHINSYPKDEQVQSVHPTIFPAADKQSTSQSHYSYSSSRTSQDLPSISFKNPLNSYKSDLDSTRSQIYQYENDQEQTDIRETTSQQSYKSDQEDDFSQSSDHQISSQQDADQIIQIHSNKNSEQIVQQNQQHTENQHQQDNQSSIQLQNPIHEQKLQEQQQRDQQQNNINEHQQGIVDNSQSTNQVQQIQYQSTNQQQEQDPFEIARLNLIESGLQVYNHENFPDEQQFQNMIQDDSHNTNNQQIRNMSLSPPAQKSSQQSNSIFRSISQTTISRSIFQSSQQSNLISILNEIHKKSTKNHDQLNNLRSQSSDPIMPSQQDSNQIIKIQHNVNSIQIFKQNQQHNDIDNKKQLKLTELPAQKLHYSQSQQLLTINQQSDHRRCKSLQLTRNLDMH